MYATRQNPQLVAPTMNNEQDSKLCASFYIYNGFRFSKFHGVISCLLIFFLSISQDFVPQLTENVKLNTDRSFRAPSCLCT